MGGGAWPILVGGVICLVNSVNERDPRLLNNPINDFIIDVGFLERLLATSERKLGATSGL